MKHKNFVKTIRRFRIREKHVMNSLLDEKISENDRTVIKSIGTQTGTFMVVLELEDVIESDAGLYKIKAKNTFGEVAASINLNFSRKSYEP